MSPIPLWPQSPPGRPDTATCADEQRSAVEIPTLVPFLIDTVAPRPLVVVLPGGGYGFRSHDEGPPVAAWLNTLGLHAAVCNYRVSPWRHPAPLDDALRAMRLVRQHAAAWKVDAQRVGILGFSAGGHLAASAATFGDRADPIGDAPAAQPGRPNALIACYPVITFGPERHDGSMRALLGAEPDPVLREELSIENSVSAANPPAFIWHSADDGAVPVANSLKLAASHARHAVPFALHVYPKAWHGVNLALDQPGTVQRWPADCAAWLAEIGWR